MNGDRMRLACVVCAACLLFLLGPRLYSADLTIDAFCSADLVTGGTTTVMFATRTNVPAQVGCSIGLPPESYGFSRPYVEFAEARTGADYGISSHQFIATGFGTVRAYQAPESSVEPERFSRASFGLSVDLTLSSLGPKRPGMIEILHLVL
jgi:hypothetical protein